MFKPHHLCATLALVALAGCSSTPPAASDPEPRAIAGQRLSSQFQREGIKVEFECRSRTGIIDRTCVSGDITAIEVTGYANSFGNSEANRENAFAAAQDEALSKLSRFIQQDINTSRVNDTFAKNIEKANDVLVENNIITGKPDTDVFGLMRELLSKSLGVRCFSMHTFDENVTNRRALMNQAIDLMAAHKVRAPAATLMAFNEVVQAHIVLDSGATLGKIILNPQ